MQYLHKAGKLISERNLYEANQLLQLAFKPYHPLSWPRQPYNNIHRVHTAYVPATQEHNLHNQLCTSFNSFVPLFLFPYPHFAFRTPNLIVKWRNFLSLLWRKMTKPSSIHISQDTASYQAITFYSWHTYNHLNSTQTMSYRLKSRSHPDPLPNFRHMLTSLPISTGKHF
jgi:hypothetical protein